MQDYVENRWVVSFALPYPYVAELNLSTMEKILEPITAVLKDWISLVLLGIGITFAPYTYFGGLFLAFAGAAISRAWEKERAERMGVPMSDESGVRFWVTVGTAFFVSTLVSIMINEHYPGWSMQFCMGLAGFASRKIINLLLDISSALARRGDLIADKMINRVFDDTDPKGGNRE